MIILGFVFFSFVLLEYLFPLRQRRADYLKRFVHNFSLTLLSSPITKLLTLPLVYYVVGAVNKQGLGLLNFISLDHTVQNVLGFLCLDYTIYWWHVLNHKVRFFLRFHQVHHSDKDMDASTVLRFHAGELIFSALVRCVVALVVGFRLEVLIAFDITVTSLATFHHSNLKLPVKLERFLSLLIVTPLFHQNHHSYYLNETDSNYSTIFSFWDRIHKTFTEFKLPNQVTIGVPSFEKTELSFLELLIMPFKKILAWPAPFLKRS